MTTFGWLTQIVARASRNSRFSSSSVNLRSRGRTTLRAGWVSAMLLQSVTPPGPKRVG